MSRIAARAHRVGLALLAPAAALVLAVAVSSAVLQASGYDAVDTYRSMLEFGSRANSIVSVVNRSIPYYVSAVAVAFGFKMGLFNIGVEGQYRIAAVAAAAVGAAVDLPAVLHVALIVLVAMLVGSAWAGVAGVLKVTRGVHEVISTIMLNFIATGISAYLLDSHLRQQNVAGDLILKTPEIPPSGRVPPLNGPLEALGVDFPPNAQLHGFLLGAVLVGLAYWVVVWRTRFGYDLRASGTNPGAARVSGVDPRAMVVRTMFLSGGVAGLVGISQLLGVFFRYSVDFPSGLGFQGIGIALLGRNNPGGMAAGALLFAFLDRSAQVLDLNGIPKEIVVIMQGVILLSVVIAYAVVQRMVEAQEVRAAARAAGTPVEAGATA